MYGEDVGVHGWCFRITTGLQNKHGVPGIRHLQEGAHYWDGSRHVRCRLKPVGRRNSVDFFKGLDQVISHVSRYRYRSRGRWLHHVIRFPYGGGLNLLEQHHDESPEAYLTHIAGHQSGRFQHPSDAKRSDAGRHKDPDLWSFLAPSSFTVQSKTSQPAHYRLHLGKARKVQEVLTIITWGAMVQTCMGSRARRAIHGHWR